ncbi:MAG: hypothetical protein ACOX63_13250 [Christensenellales bacterium]|jgi:putative aldouronate transport system substrate-binding protein
MKKFLSLALSLVMVLSVCAFGVAEELTTIKILCKNDFDSEIKSEDWEKYDVSKVFIAKLEELGIRLELECIDNASFPNVVKTRMAAGVDLPDIVSVAFEGGISASEVIQWGQNGLIIPASELMDKYDEDDSIRTYWNEKCPGTLAANTAADGNLYWFAYLYRATSYSMETGEELPPYGWRTMSLRQDWVEKVGETMKLVYTPDELFDLLVKFQENDVNDNGLKDEVVCLKIDQFGQGGMADGFGLSTSTLCYVDQNGKVTSNFYNPHLVDYLAFMNKLYVNGLYDTAAFSGDLFSSELITQNKAAVTYNYSAWSDYETQMGVEGAQYTPFILDMDGDLSTGWKAHGDVAGITFNQHFVTSACKNPEAVTKLFDFIYTDEYAYLCTAGIEGQTYTKDDKGVVTRIDHGPEPTDKAEKEAFRIKTSDLFGTSAGLYVLPAINVVPSYTWEVNPNAEEYQQVKSRVIVEFNKNIDTCWFEGGTKYAMATDEQREEIEEFSEQLSTYASELLTNIILGERSIDSLEEGVKELEKLGLTRYMEIQQERHNRLLELSK